MAEIELKNKNNSNKFLDLRGVEILWTKVKEQINATAENAAAAAKLTEVSYDSSNDTIAVQVGDISMSATIAKATVSKNGLMSKEDFSKLAGIEASAQVNVIEGVAVRGTVNGSIKSTQLPVMQVEGADYSVSVLDVESDLSKVAADVDPFHVASAYAAKAYADGLANAALDARDILEGKINTVSGVAKANADAIAALQTTASTHALASDLNTVSASVAANAKAISDHAKEFTTYQGTVSDNLEQLENRITVTATALATRVTTLESTSSSHATLLEGLRADVNANATAIEKAVSDAADALATAKDELTTDITAISDAVDLLNSGSTVTGSVDYKIAEVEAKLLGDNRDKINDAYETLSGIATWIENDKTGAAAMSAEINKLKSDKLDVTAFNSFKDANTQALGLKLDKTTFESTVGQINAAVALKADTSYVNTELGKKVDKTAFEQFKTDNTTAINTAVNGEADTREAADDAIKAAAVTTITSSYNETSGELSINYAFINDPTSATSFVLCESISDSELDALFV